MIDDKLIRDYLGLHYNNRWPIFMEEGDDSPQIKGEPWYYETNGGTYIRHPSAYSKVGWSNMNYINSTRHIIVGQDWKNKNNEK